MSKLEMQQCVLGQVFTNCYFLKNKETGELRTTGSSSHCFLNRAGKPISLKRMYPELDTKFFEMKGDVE